MRSRGNFDEAFYAVHLFFAFEESFGIKKLNNLPEIKFQTVIGAIDMNLLQLT